MPDFVQNTYHDFPVAVKVYIENRSNSRVALTPQNIIVRLPKFMPEHEQQKRLIAHLDWARETIRKKGLYQKYHKKTADYHLKTIEIYQQQFQIKVLEIKTGRNRLSYKGNGNIEFYLLDSLDEKSKINAIQIYLSKFTTKFFLNKITTETHRLNELYFQENIKEVKLSYTTSKWGSCSSKQKIVFSTKLLLLPPKVIEYVIVHELAHLKEMNHSQKFWEWVISAMPDYKKWDKWLSKHGNEYDF